MNNINTFQRFFVIVLIFSFASVDSAFSQYRKPSNSDIEWLLGKSSARTHQEAPKNSPCEPVSQEPPPAPPRKSEEAAKSSAEITQTSANTEVADHFTDDFTDDFPQGIPWEEILPVSAKKPVTPPAPTKNEPKLTPKAAPLPSEEKSVSKCTKPLEEPEVYNGNSDVNSIGCRSYTEECVLSKPFCDFFRSSICSSGTRHGIFCRCLPCIDLDTPDMVGDAAWIPDRFVRLTSGGQTADFSAPTAIVSRLNLAEHFNAEVRNRIWFDYRHLNNAMSLTTGGSTGNFRQSSAADQFTFGIESRLTDNLSAELRVPIVNQFDSKQTGPNPSGNSKAELGNLSLIFKHVLCRTSNLTFAGGLGIVFPTAEDWRLPTTTLLRNKSLYLVPYLGFQWHPNERTFGHFLVQTDVPVSDNQLRFADQSLDVKEPTAVRLGWQIGRWFYRNDLGSHTCRLGGLLELDYTITSGYGKSGNLTNGADSISIGSFGHKPKPVNIVLGMPILFGQFAVTNAVILPLAKNDRQFSVGYDFSLSRRF